MVRIKTNKYVKNDYIIEKRGSEKTNKWKMITFEIV